MNYFAPVLEILLIVVLGIVLHRLLVHLTVRLIKNDFIPDPLEPLITGLIKWLIIIAATLLILQVFGIPVSHVLASLSTVIVLFAIAFVAMWSALSNILCSFLLLLFPPFRFGDEIEIKEPDKERGVRGIVKNLNLFYTTLTDTSDLSTTSTLIRIPNTMFFQRVIICHEKKNTRELKLGDPVQPPSNTIT